jgi:aminopeptidase-like protein
MDIKKKYYPMLKWAKELFPFCRSITGKGLKDTILFLKKINTDLKILSFKSGKKVFDWRIPDEWNIKDSFIKHTSGKKYAQFSKSNLHIMGYSTPIDKWISKNELLKHIYTQKDLPNAVPYVTSFYKKNWGFCLSESEKKKLPNGKFKVFIDSNLQPGLLNLAEAKLKGRSKKEIFFSTNICHPSMANNELSGPVLASALLKYIKNNYKKTYYSYRFIFVPETIGSIAYLSKKYREMKKRIIAGFVLSCVGDERNYSHIFSPNYNLADKALSSALIGLKNVKKYSYLERGSDERQYCSPGIDLPVCGFCRSKYGKYPEYHTDSDNFNVVTQKGLEDSFNVIKNIINAFEIGLFPETRTLGEPQLSKRNLYPEISKRGNIDAETENRLNILAYSDGKTNIFDICKKINLPLEQVLLNVKNLKKFKLLKIKYL